MESNWLKNNTFHHSEFADLDRLVVAAREGGALGAKPCGAGSGGNMIALVAEETRGRVDMALRLAGAKGVIVTEIR